MIIFYSPNSPFVRKVLVAGIEAGVAGRIELRRCSPGVIDRDMEVVRLNPLGQVPTLVLSDGETLADSRVICEYFDALTDAKLFPPPGKARWAALAEQSAADGLMDAAVLCRIEAASRPEDKRWDAWSEGQFRKVGSVLDFFSERASELDGRVDIGAISLGCALSYLDFRFQDYDWRTRHPDLARWYGTFRERPSMRDTAFGFAAFPARR